MTIPLSSKETTGVPFCRWERKVTSTVLLISSSVVLGSIRPEMGCCWGDVCVYSWKLTSGEPGCECGRGSRSLASGRTVWDRCDGVGALEREEVCLDGQMQGILESMVVGLPEDMEAGRGRMLLGLGVSVVYKVG